MLSSSSRSVSCSVVSDSLQPHGLQPTRLLCPWNSPGKNTAVGCCSLLQRIFPTQGSNPGLLHCRQILYHLGHREVLLRTCTEKSPHSSHSNTFFLSARELLPWGALYLQDLTVTQSWTSESALAKAIWFLCFCFNLMPWPKFFCKDSKKLELQRDWEPCKNSHLRKGSNVYTIIFRTL